MSGTEERIVRLPAEHAAYIDKKVAAGAYATTSDVVRAALRALQERDELMEAWLREEVAPVYDAMQAGPARGMPMDEVFARIALRHQSRVKAGE